MSFFRRIKVRLTLWYVFLIAIILILFSVVLYLSLRGSLLKEVDTSLHALGDQLTASLDYEEGGDSEEGHGEDGEDTENGRLSFQNREDDGDYLVRLTSDGYVVRLADGAGQTLEGAGPYEDVLIQATDSKSGYRTVSAPGGRWRVYTMVIGTPSGHPEYLLQVGTSLDRIDSTLSKLLVFELTAISLALVLAIALGIFMAGRALKPIDEIAQLAGSIRAVNLSSRLDLNLPDDELGRLVATFNDMLERLEEGFSRQKRFVSEAAHELRTPLTAMKGTTEVCLRRDRTVAEYKKSLEELRGEVDHLVGLSKDLLSLSSMESESTDLNQEDLDLTDVVSSAVEIITPVAQSKGIGIEFETPDPTPFRGDKSKINRMVLNILDNAVKYSPRGSHVSVSVESEGEWITVAISDNGPGISDDELENVFDSFHRLDEARGMNPSGVGLGLSIARWIARAHGGNITVESQLGRGSTFKIGLPCRG